MKCLSAFACEWPHCACGVSAYPWLAKKHGIERLEWERRFTAYMSERAVDGDSNKLSGDALIEAVETELEAWRVPDWTVTLPEEAADEQMRNWEDDQEP